MAGAEAHERAGADDARDLAVELLVPAAFEELALEQERARDASARRSICIASRSRAEDHVADLLACPRRAAPPRRRRRRSAARGARRGPG